MIFPAANCDPRPGHWLGWASALSPRFGSRHGRGCDAVNGYCWLTPPAPAAIALMVLDQVTASRLVNAQLPEQGRCRFTRIYDSSDQVIDEVVVWSLDQGLVEIGFHGGPGVRQAVEHHLAALGEPARRVRMVDGMILLGTFTRCCGLATRWPC